MAEFQLREIDADIVQRVKALARERNCSANDVFLSLIRSALGLVHDRPVSIVDPLPPTAKVSTVRADVDALADDEAAVLRAAMEALEQLPEDKSPFRIAGRDDA